MGLKTNTHGPPNNLRKVHISPEVCFMAVLRMEAGREHVFHELIHPEMSTSDRFLCTSLESIRTRMYLDLNNPNPNYTFLFV